VFGLTTACLQPRRRHSAQYPCEEPGGKAEGETRARRVGWRADSRSLCRAVRSIPGNCRLERPDRISTEVLGRGLTYPFDPLHLVHRHVLLLRSDDHAWTNDPHIRHHFLSRELIFVNQIGLTSALILSIILTSYQDPCPAETGLAVYRHLHTSPLDCFFGKTDKFADDLVGGVGAIVEIHLNMIDPDVKKMSSVIPSYQHDARCKQMYSSSFSRTTSPTFSRSNTFKTHLKACDIKVALVVMVVVLIEPDESTVVLSTFSSFNHPFSRGEAKGTNEPRMLRSPFLLQSAGDCLS